MEKKPLTDNQRKVLEYLLKTKAQRHNFPSLHEVQAHFGFKAVGTVQDYLSALQRKGYIRRTAKARDIEVLDSDGMDMAPEGLVRLPIVGQVAAGTPILAEENIEGHFLVDREAAVKNSFLLRVRGDSMTGAHILDRDLVVVRPQKVCENGEIAVCLVEGEATVKRFYRRAAHIELKAENPAYQPILVKPQQKFSLVGKVCGVIRLNMF
ncbi:MAG TPA: transcriptional repressor LexA [Verrucomicrobiae bacterium]|jgi:repressor LexA|nr:transcriptional repressor LexA [Verrucomicrobiae bacterium]